MSIMNLLLSTEGVDINHLDFNHNTLLELAINDKNFAYTKLALQNDPEMIHDKDSLILFLIFFLNEDIFILIIKQKLKEIFSLLLKTCIEDIKKYEISFSCLFSFILFYLFNASFIYFHSIVTYTSLELVQILSTFEGIDVNCLSENDKLNPISLCIIYNQPNIFNFLINVPNIDVNTSVSNPLYFATQRHITPAVESLLKKGADPNIRTKNLENSIELARRLRFVDLYKIFKEYNNNKK